MVSTTAGRDLFRAARALKLLAGLICLAFVLGCGAQNAHAEDLMWGPTPASGALGETTGQIQNVATGQCLTSGGQAAGNPAYFWTCNSSRNQLWNEISWTGGGLQVQNQGDANMCLYTQGSTWDGATVVLQACATGPGCVTGPAYPWPCWASAWTMGVDWLSGDWIADARNSSDGNSGFCWTSQGDYYNNLVLWNCNNQADKNQAFTGNSTLWWLDG
jgi:Ricin-type beta-trefoil lectin domain